MEFIFPVLILLFYIFLHVLRKKAKPPVRISEDEMKRRQRLREEFEGRMKEEKERFEEVIPPPEPLRAPIKVPVPIHKRALDFKSQINQRDFQNVIEDREFRSIINTRDQSLISDKLSESLHKDHHYHREKYRKSRIQRIVQNAGSKKNLILLSEILIPKH